jgi:hypothetical protein
MEERVHEDSSAKRKLKGKATILMLTTRGIRLNKSVDRDGVAKVCHQMKKCLL